jgi:pyruvate/2-oxoglutarate dehydrogenase complex dihydrolipoamide dehydrogenase (E3) component
MSELVVIGGGPAGIAGALRAAELGADVTLVEGRELGGTCVNDGCVPTRVLARTARMAREARDAHLWGVEVGGVTVDWKRITARVAETVTAVGATKGGGAELRGHGVSVRLGEFAHFLDDHTLAVGDDRLQADAFLLCVGGAPRRLPFDGAELATLPNDVVRWPELPPRVAIVGSGSTGAQLATVFSSLGTRVTLLDVAPRIMPHADDDIAVTLTNAFTDQGVTVTTGIEGVRRLAVTDDDAMRLEYESEGIMQSLEVDAVVLATGWPTRTDGLGLEAAGVEHRRGRIPVDAHLRTNVPHIFAPGDANQTNMLVQSASVEGVAAATNAVLGPTRSTPHALLPWGGFTDPDVAGVGLGEADARAHDEHCVVATIPMASIERAIIDERRDGFLKLIADRRRSMLLGAHAAGESAVEIIQAVTTAMAAGADPATLARVEFAYPTYSAIIGSAAAALMDAQPTAA